MTDDSRRTAVTVGFIGAGGIAAALARGFCGADEFAGKIFMYNPHPEKVRALKNLYPGKITSAESNQEVIDSAEVIIPAVLPDILRRIAPRLKFRRENRVAHIAAGIKLAEAARWYAPAQTVARAVPMPFVSRRIGPVLLFFGDPVIRSLFSLVGSVEEVLSERHLETLAAITGMMVSYFALVGETVKWGMSKGVDFQSALKYTTSMNEALSVMMSNECGEDTGAFLAENTTPRGLNELGLKIMRESGAYGQWTDALEQIGKRCGL